MSKHKFKRGVAYFFTLLVIVLCFQAFYTEQRSDVKIVFSILSAIFILSLINSYTWPDFKLWHERVFRIITLERAAELGLSWATNVHGDSINILGCRSLWHDAIGRVYRVSDMRATHTAEIRFKMKSPVECSKEQFEEWVRCKLDGSKISYTNPLKNELLYPHHVYIFHIDADKK